MYQFQMERAWLHRLYEEEVRELSAPMREATIFQKYLETIPLHIENHDFLAGWYGYPEEFPREIQAVREQHQQAVQAYAKQREEHPDPDFVFDSVYITRGSGYDLGHHTLDYKRLLARGITAYLADVEQELAKTAANTDKREYLKAMQLSLKATEIFSRRYADLAESMAEQAAAPEEQARLGRIAALCRKVPMQPVEDFYEAMQAAYFLWTLNCISDFAWVSISFGSFDQFMYPYYQRSKEKGMTDEQAQALLLQLFRLLDTYGGQDCVISVGGMDSSGNDLTNALSYLIVETEKKSRLRAPLLAARINPHTPPDFLLSLVCTTLFEIGQPSFYSEEECKKAVMARGIDEQTAAGYAINSCMGMVTPGAEMAAMWGCVINMHLPLELALNGGKPLKGQLPIPLKTPPRSEYASLDNLYAQYTLYLRELFAYVKERNLSLTAEGARNTPSVWVSAVTRDCISAGRDGWDGGAAYHNVTVEAMAFGNTGDALTAIDELIFKKKAFTIAQLLEAAQQNFVGFDDLHIALSRCPKYGMNIDEADANARRVLSLLADICEGESRKGKPNFLPSLHTLDTDVILGGRYYATLDGRLAGEPINKNAGPANATRTFGPTSVALSAAKLNQYRLSGGQALDLHIGGRNMDSPAKKEKLAAFIRTYLSLGGLQLQINGLSSETLQKAYDAPQEYAHLIVRIGGHSRYFNELPDVIKLEFIRRISIEEGAKTRL